MRRQEPERDDERFWPFGSDRPEDEADQAPPQPSPPLDDSPSGPALVAPPRTDVPRRPLGESVLPLSERRRPAERLTPPVRRPLPGRAVPAAGGERRARFQRAQRAQSATSRRPAASRVEESTDSRRLRVSRSDVGLLALTVVVLVLVYLALV